MADFTALKAEIQNYVKQNGNNAITGDGLQAILISMVQALGDSAINDLASSLSNEVLARQGADTTLQGNIDAANTAITTLATFIGNGYMFRGIATLETVPSALGGKVFYITATAGQYTNMGGITVSEGVSILAYDGTSWSASLVIGIDATPTNGSNGLVRSGGVYTSLTQENARAIAAETSSAEFNSTTKKLIFKNSAGTVLYEMDATPFIVDGMVDDVYISGGNLIISFNTDAGKQDISIPLTAIFNPANYYDKTAVDALLLPITTRLAAGYIYMGLAIPSGTPDTSVGKVFYLTATAGTYTNYGNLTVNAGITILSYNGSVWSADLLVAIDSTPTQNSNALVTSGGVQNELALGAVYDVSAKNPTAGINNDGKWESLSALLSDANLNTLIPTSVRKGGMSIKFVCSSDNKYVQARCIADEFTTDISMWVICGNEIVEETPEWGEVVVDKNKKVLYGVKTDGNFYFGAGCPPQVVAYVLTHINDVIAQLNLKVDKVSGKSLINEIYASTCSVIETPEYASVVVDENNKILEGFTSDGKKIVFADFIVKNILSIGGEKIYVYEDRENRFEIITDKLGKIVSFRTKEGVLVENVGIKTPTLIIGNENVGAALQALKERLNTPNIVMPENIYVLESTKVQVFKSQLAPIHNPENNELRIQLISQAVSKPWGDNFDFLYEYEVDMTDTDFILKFGLYNDITGLTLSDVNTKFVHVAKAQSPSSIKNVICIGDSFTGADMWVSELRRLLTGEVCNWYSDSADSDIVADTLTNINFIGTQNAVSGKTPCEGYAGEDYQFFCGKGGGIHSGVGPFVNPNTGNVDFDYYMNTGDVKGTIQNPSSGSKIDYAIIILGTNQHHDVKYIKTIWNALLSHNPNIKVIIAGQCFAIPYGDKSPIRDKKTYVYLSEMAQKTNVLLSELCSQTDYKDNFLWCDYNPRIDAFNNMGYELVYPNIRNKDDAAKIRRSLDDVHPARAGYFQMADAIRPAFHYWFLN